MAQRARTAAATAELQHYAQTQTAKAVASDGADGTDDDVTEAITKLATVSVAKSVTDTVTGSKRQGQGQGQRDSTLPQEIKSPSAAAEAAPPDDLEAGISAIRKAATDGFALPLIA